MCIQGRGGEIQILYDIEREKAHIYRQRDTEQFQHALSLHLFRENKHVVSSFFL